MTPKNTRFKRKQKYENIEQRLKKIPFNKHAIKSGFKQRKEKKITGKSLLLGFILIAMQGKNTFHQWAEQIGLLTGKSVSKQGVWDRINSRFVRFLSLILTDALLEQTSITHLQVKKHEWIKYYKRVLVQDSTVIALPSWLSWCFPGNVSRGEKKAQLKIQVVYDILANHFVYFEITPYTANDQSKSKDILSIATSEDLVLRDLGYFVLDSFDGMNHQHIHFTSRLRYGVNIYDMKTGKEINLYNQIKKQERFDQWVMLGEKQKFKIRLVVIKLPQEQADIKKRKAKKDRDRRLNHSKKYYDMLGYSFYITTENEKRFSPCQIAGQYGLRWRIETIFKCWKSNFHLQKLIPQDRSLTKERAEAIIYMMLIFILLFQVTIYHAAEIATEKAKGGTISLLKLCKYISNHIELFIKKNLNSLMPQILYYCRYDKRCDLQNFVQKLKLT